MREYDEKVVARATQLYQLDYMRLVTGGEDGDQREAARLAAFVTLWGEGMVADSTLEEESNRVGDMVLKLTQEQDNDS